MRPAGAGSADARPGAGNLAGGRSGARRGGEGGPVDWPASLRRGRPRQPRELHRKPRSARPGELWLVVVDASASTRRQGALSQAKGLLAQLFEQAYRQRARLALLHANGTRPQWVWQGRKASRAARKWLEGLGAGGGTPLIEALGEAASWLARRQRLHPAERRWLLVVTDGRLRDWPPLAASACPALLVDIECTPIRLGRACLLAEQLSAEYRHIEQLASL
ncbi:magnesium chelatase (plasmid) [Azotobacter chroococcum]|nr:magnesium chelatase [Azotobacter chroococcum]